VLGNTQFSLGMSIVIATVRFSMNTSLSPALGALLLAFTWAVSIRADVTPAAVFSDRVVLQRDKPVPIWGTADAGEKVTVIFGGQHRETITGSDGRWSVQLDALSASPVGTDLLISGKNTLTLHDVVVGEVWLCSGQSNMEWPVMKAAHAQAEIAAANFPLIRHLKVERLVAEAPVATLKTGGWQPASPQTVGTFTAVGYFFARDLHQKLGVPIGIIHSSWGGTPVEAWMSSAALASDPTFAVVQERWKQNLADFPTRQAEYEINLAGWAKAEAEARQTTATKAQAAPRGRNGQKPDPQAAHNEWLRQNPRPRAPRGAGDPWTPGGLFNGMIHPLLPYALRGALWYQGESNAERAAEYHALFSALITGWRAHFAQGDFPFYWVNLANYAVPTDGLERGRTYAFLREAQTKTLALPNTGQAIAIDIGDPKDIHPLDKQEVGRRLALLARNRDYDLVCDDAGPTFVSATREGPTMRVRLKHAAGGLVAYNRPVQSLELAGADRVFHPAEGRIDRDTLIVTSTAVREPVAVRYAWTNAPDANLHNGAGLPAVPFRTDDW
jgi:sialate O-acetylesterase